MAGEFALLAKVRAAVRALGRGEGVVVGIGDDCAVVRGPTRRGRADRGGVRGSAAAPLQVLTTDTMVEGVHFREGWIRPRELGAKALRAAVSDVSAMGARARYVLLSLELPSTGSAFDERGALALVRGVAAEARVAGATLVGGNVSAAPRLALTITVTGEAAKPVLRSGARPGDLVFVTGTLGGAASGVRVLSSHAARTDDARDAACVRAWRRPPLRIAFASALGDAGLARAMVDVSDGLAQDLGHLADESGVTIVLDPSSVPVHRASRRRFGEAATDLALGGGEDYELAFTARRSSRAAIEALAREHRVPVSVIGAVAKGKPRVVDAEGRVVAVEGFDHLRGSPGKARMASARRRR